MITVNVTFSDGDTITTGINTDLGGARAYYLGQWFNLGHGPEDHMAQAITVEQLTEERATI